MQNNTSPEFPASARALFNTAFKIGSALGRKFEASDMTIPLRQAAQEYALLYQGDFEFMVDMRNRMAGGAYFMSDGQAKGVLNLLMADARRRMERRAPKTETAPLQSTDKTARVVLADVPDGRFRVTLADGSHLAIRIARVDKDSKLGEGSRVISTRINGDDWMGMAHVSPQGAFKLWRSAAGELRARISNAVEILDTAETQDGWLIAGLAFAQEGSQCFFCGRDLDTPESLLVGYGPKCADKHGLPWGEKATPMAVRLAQAEEAAKVSSAATLDAAPTQEETPSAPAPITAPSPHWSTQRDPLAYVPPVSLDEARARGRSRTYAEIFGED
jgi:hypothetical protein